MTKLLRAAYKGWSAHFLACEAVLGLAVGGLVGFVCHDALAGNRATFYAGTAAIFASLLGFVIATMTILITLMQAERVKIIQESGQHRTLWRTFKSANVWLATATLMAMMAFPLDRDAQGKQFIGATCAVGAVGTLAALRIVRCLWILHQILAAMLQPPPSNPVLED